MEFSLHRMKNERSPDWILFISDFHWKCSENNLGKTQLSISIVFGFISDELRLYHNGRLTNSTFSQNTAPLGPNADKSLVFGRGSTDFDGSYCNCEIDEVEILEVVLNAQEVSDLFDSQSRSITCITCVQLTVWFLPPTTKFLVMSICHSVHIEGVQCNHYLDIFKLVHFMIHPAMNLQPHGDLTIQVPHWHVQNCSLCSMGGWHSTKMSLCISLWTVSNQ